MLGDLLPTGEAPIIDVVEPAPRYLYSGGIDRRAPIYRGDVFYLAPTTIGPLVPTRTTAAYPTYPTLPAQQPTTPVTPVPPPPVYTPFPVYAHPPTTGHAPSGLMVAAVLLVGAVILFRGR